jgi:hypothetical protein
LLGKMFWFQSSAGLTAFTTLLVLLLVAFVFAHFGKNTFEMTHQWSLAMRCIWLCVFAACVLRIVTWQDTPFLYFQF